MVVMHNLLRECADSVPKDVEILARTENIESQRLASLIASGRVVVPANPRRDHTRIAIGEGCRVKVNVNIGTSGVRCDSALEMEKGAAALANGADALMDLSTGGDLTAMRKEILSFNTTVGTVPIYEAVRRAGNAIDVDADCLFNTIRDHCKQGVDFLTLHCGVNKQAVAALRRDPRVMGVVSRGGAFHVAMMESSGEENPLYTEYDYLLEILDEAEVTISLGDGMRPGAIVDSGKLAKSTEYLTLGELARRAHDVGVQRMIEGPGHMPIDEIPYNVKMIKEITQYAPLYLLGPLVTDIYPGYDHVSGAIGGSVAAMNGADFLCMVSPAEHLALPDTRDIIEGTRVAKLSAHVGDSVRNRGRWLADGEAAMAEARRDLDWETQYDLAKYGEDAKKVRDRDGELDTCSMCGDLCAVKLVREIFKND